MATITKRGGGWYVQVRRKGFPPQYQTFGTKVEGQRWARELEQRLDCASLPTAPAPPQRLNLRDLLRRYADHVTPKKRGALSERYRLGKMAKAWVCEVALDALRPSHFAAYRDHRLLSAKASTVRRELSLFRVTLEVARREWGVTLGRNPLDDVARPVAYDARQRRLKGTEAQRLEEALVRFRNRHFAPLVWFLVETGMRRGEALSLQWEHLDLENRTALIPCTKNGRPRTIPLTDKAIELLSGQPRLELRVFPVSAVAFRQGWLRLLERTGIADLRIHDLRHEAISRFAEMGLNMPELALISGHRDVRTLHRYTHLRPTDLALKLKGRSWQPAVHHPAPGDL